MAISNGYCSLAELKAWLATTTDTKDAILEVVIESASREIDHFCGRRFYLDSVASARTYATRNALYLDVDDIGASAISIATDTNGDGTFATAWASTTFQTMPNNALVNGKPITRIGGFTPAGRVTNEFLVNGAYATRVTAQWGWPAVPTEVKQATLLLASRIKSRAETPHGLVTFSDIGAGMRVVPLDYDVQALVSPLRRIPA